MGVRVDELYQVNGGPVAHNPGHRMLIWVDMKAQTAAAVVGWVAGWQQGAADCYRHGQGVLLVEMLGVVGCGSEMSAGELKTLSLNRN